MFASTMSPPKKACIAYLWCNPPRFRSCCSDNSDYDGDDQELGAESAGTNLLLPYMAGGQIVG